MSAADVTAAKAGETGLTGQSIERSMRLWAGLVLMAFVVSHLLNHALGIFGVAIMSEAQEWRVALWRSWPGSVLLYGALGVHIILSLKRVVGRRTWRMPKLEVVQLILGILIPLLLVKHVVGTRILSSIAGIDDNYTNLLRYLWPDHALWQSTALIVVWTHGVIGIYYAFHTRPWFRRAWLSLLLVAVLVPVLALAGFIAAGREALTLTTPPETWTAAQLAAQASAMSAAAMAVYGGLGVLLVAIGVRAAVIRLRPSVTVRYTGHGEITGPKGLTLLEISRRGHIPHPSTCGGKGRCATCRVLVLGGLDELPAPAGLELRMLQRIRAPQQVRLACQIRPSSDLSVRVLLPMDIQGIGRTRTDTMLDWGSEETLTILFADLRGFSELARNQLPSDLVVLLSRVIDDLTQATLAHGGRVALVETDGIMAIFGIGDSSRSGAKASIEAARDMLRSVATIGRDFGAALSQPLRVGIGIHTGPVVLSRIGDAERGYQLVAVGEPVVIASRLEEATKELASDCVISRDTLSAAGLMNMAGELRPVSYKNSETPISACLFPEIEDLKRLLRARGIDPATRSEPASKPASEPAAATAQPEA